MNKAIALEMAKKSMPLIVVVYCAIGVYPIVTYTYLNHEPYIFAFKYVGPATLALFLYVSLDAMRSQNIFLKIISIFQIVLKASFVTIMTTGYLLLINDYLSDPQEKCFNGEIVEKWKNSESLLFTDYNFKVNDNGAGKQYSLNVSKNDFNLYNEGQLFKQCLKEGILGINFK